MKIMYTAIFVNKNKLKHKYKQIHENEFYDHSTIKFMPESLDGLPLGEKTIVEIIGRLTTDKVDVLLVKNPLSSIKHPHITLSTANGVKPFMSNIEISENLDKIEELHDSVEGIYGFFDGVNVVTSLQKRLDEIKERFYKALRSGK